MRFIRVLFPLPDGPIMAIHSPGSTFMFIPVSASTRFSPRQYTFVSSLASITRILNASLKT
jgi:hypothetical protein